jgi:cell division septation protein DedD
MAEVQTSTQSGELSQRFIEFVMMQAQNAALFLGQIPNPQTGQGEVNLELARMFIDQLAMIQEKTRGNLSTEEAGVIRNTLANLQMAFVEVSQHEGKGGAAASTASPAAAPLTSQEPAQAPPAAETPAAPSAGEPESRKKFTKSYGA